MSMIRVIIHIVTGYPAGCQWGCRHLEGMDLKTGVKFEVKDLQYFGFFWRDDLHIILSFVISHQGGFQYLPFHTSPCRRFKNVKPDFDNTLKHLCDCLNKLVWKDDTQVVRAHIRKEYSLDRPRTVMQIRELENG